jgi:Flp pilus assembly secretin CpaC
MTASCLGGRAAQSALHWLAAALLFLCAASGATAGPPTAEPPILVELDQATLFKLPDRAATVVIGNPLIADVSIETGGIAVVTAKGYGTTNVVVLDRAGVVLMDKEVAVTVPRDHVVFVYRGAARETYSCTPDCSARVNLGDNPEWFDKMLTETVSRTTQALSAGTTVISGK